MIFSTGLFWKWLYASLRSKRSRTKRMKFGPRVLVFHIRDVQKMGREQKGGRKGVGEGKEERRDRLPATPSILKNPFAHEWGSWLVRCGHLDWQVYQVRLNDSSNNSCVTHTCHQRKLLKSFSCCCNYRLCMKIKQEPADLNSLIWQPRLALLGHFSCSDNERLNLRSQRLVVVFPAFSPHFSCCQNVKNFFCAARISFASYGNACYAG